MTSDARNKKKLDEQWRPAANHSDSPSKGSNRAFATNKETNVLSLGNAFLTFLQQFLCLLTVVDAEVR